ncbi:restriction endonuclease subunit S [Campylobacter upsaliensis]|nr:restriction endonuclease subunit S [Campylobacter upsaliensis]EJW3040722.1 restriction endonuclease subunit S [Campylobacter upsaliensis]ELM7647638.1 restriction endonuclease subunit S [Campylobacter upsaliensis]
MRVYKPSGIEWLGEIPQSWEIKRLRHIFKEVSIKKCGNEQQLCATQSYGVIPKKLYSYKTVEVISSDLNSFKLVKKDNFVISLRSFEGGIEHSNYQGIISPAYTILEPQVEIYSFYFKFLFKSSFFISTLNIHKIGIREGQNISYASLQYTPIPLPPLQEQKEIAEFLDSKCEKIQNYIDKKQKLITLLQEKKQALINEAVTKGLNPNIEFKNSGIAYLGLIPHHWEVVKVKYIATTNIGLVYDPSEIATNENVGYPVLRANNIQNGKIDYKDVIYVAKKIDDKQLAISGDLLMCVRNGSENLLGKTAKIENNNFSFGAFTAIIRSDLNNYLYWIFQTEMLKKSISSFIVSIGIGQISQDDIKNFKIPLPPLQEQKEIAEFLDKKCEKINSAIEKTKKQIELVKEYKNTLINEAVCGRIACSRDFSPFSKAQNDKKKN